MSKAQVKIHYHRYASFSYAHFDRADLATIKFLLKRFKQKNPDWIRNDRYGYYNGATPEYVYSYIHDQDKQVLHFYRGCYRKMVRLLKKLGHPVTVLDKTFLPKETVDVEFVGKLLAPQKKAIKDFYEAEEGILIAYPSFGKTVFGIYLFTIFCTPTLILVHSKNMMKQWIKEIIKFTNLTKDQIGGVGGILGYKPKLGPINIATEQSLAKPKHRAFFKDKIGMLIVDECQMIGANTFATTPHSFKARYRVGISADIERRDGKDFMITDAIGPVIHRAEDSDTSGTRIKCELNLVRTRYEDESYAFDGSYSNLITRMAGDEERNQLIVDRAQRWIEDDRLILILIERKFQSAILHEMLQDLGYKGVLFIGKMDAKELKKSNLTKSQREILSGYDDNKAEDLAVRLGLKKKINYIIGTQKGNVGLSIRTIEAGLVTTPTGNNLKLLEQKVGRIERRYDDELTAKFGEKRVPQMDYLWDRRIPSLKRQGFNIRDRFQRKIKTVNPYKGES